MAKRRKPKKDDASLFDDGDPSAIAPDQTVPLHETAQTAYLNYALSVITSRALPDVRDGLKPVQRRILFTMWQQRLTAENKHRKCANVTGEVMGKYHPHGDQAIYDALVRMAQPWVMRATLVDGSGNFGSLDGDPPAAYRYTECRLTPIASQFLDDIANQTVHFRPNYDGTREEPVVLPSKVPNLLVNGSSGIAVGMATNIPPHNLIEVCNACLKLLKDPELKPYQLIANDAIQGPDFPTGGQIVTSRDELRDIYKNGGGSIKIRGTVQPAVSAGKSSKILIVDSIPYGINKSTLIERIAEVVISRKMPLITDVRDLSTEDVRIEIELKKDADEAKVLAYLYKHTPLQTTFAVNLTCLVPTENPDVAAPVDHTDIKTILWHFLHFRHGVVTKRLQHELASLERRIHILNGFALVFDVLDEIIKIIRGSDGKADAAKRIMKRFPLPKGLDEEQTDAILELKLYRLAKLEINLILDELKEKNRRAREIRKLLAQDDDDMTSGRWKIIAEELIELRDTYGKKNPNAKRLTVIETVDDEPEFSADDFIIAEDTVVIVTRDGWTKRQKEVKDLGTTRLREGDSVLAAEAGSTRATIVFMSSLGVAYTARIVDIPATTGYGEPIQKFFKMKDGEKIIAAFSLDPRVNDELTSEHEDYAPRTHALAATSDGYALRFGLDAFIEPSTRSGRKFARPKAGVTVVGVEKIHGDETILAATELCRAMICPAEEVNYLAGPGKGVQLIKLGKDDHLLGFKASMGDRDLLTVETNRGAQKTISTVKYKRTSRGGKGWEIQKNGKLSHIIPDEATLPAMRDDEN